MAHISENVQPLKVKYIYIESQDALERETCGFTDVCIIRLPPCKNPSYSKNSLQDIGKIVANVATNLEKQATLIILGEIIDLVQIQADMPAAVRYQHWIAIKRTNPKIINNCFLPNHHFGALICTRYQQALHHTKTRIKYTYCPVCDKTTKDYGGKKHTYHKDGTLISDVWRDLNCELEGDIDSVINRLADLFGIDSYKEIRVFD